MKVLDTPSSDIPQQQQLTTSNQDGNNSNALLDPQAPPSSLTSSFVAPESVYLESSRQATEGSASSKTIMTDDDNNIITGCPSLSSLNSSSASSSEATSAAVVEEESAGVQVSVFLWWRYIAGCHVYMSSSLLFFSFNILTFKYNFFIFPSLSFYPNKQKNKERCFLCQRKVGLLGFQCRCGFIFCGSHRHADQHDCQFDYRELARQQLSKANQKVVADKLNRIWHENTKIDTHSLWNVCLFACVAEALKLFK